jgi:hypothetical protein
MARTKFDDQLSRFIQRGRRRRKDPSYKPAKRSTLPASFRPAKQRTGGY